MLKILHHDDALYVEVPITQADIGSRYRSLTKSAYFSENTVGKNYIPITVTWRVLDSVQLQSSSLPSTLTSRCARSITPLHVTVCGPAGTWISARWLVYGSGWPSNVQLYFVKSGFWTSYTQWNSTVDGFVSTRSLLCAHFASCGRCACRVMFGHSTQQQSANYWPCIWVSHSWNFNKLTDKSHVNKNHFLITSFEVLADDS